MIRFLSYASLFFVLTLFATSCGDSNCRSHRDCSDGFYCKQRTCLPKCQVTDDCQLEETCNTQGQCIKKTLEPDEANKGDAGDNESSSAIEETKPPKECQKDEHRECYEGLLVSKGIGLCKAGKQHCIDGKWGNCVGQVIPVEEECDGKDNDCDGQTDEDLKSCGCKQDNDCPPSKSSCRGGVCILLCSSNAQCKPSERCYEGYCQACPTDSARDKEEECNGKDDDCDGKADEEIADKPCYDGKLGTSGKGICKAGTKTCVHGTWSDCKGQQLPKSEVCNNQDDDCDGQIDNNIQAKSCYTGSASSKNKGRCQDGKSTCSKGNWSACQGEIKPTTEVCNGKDDDCDGKTDENIASTSCTDSSAKGICRQGKSSCVSGKTVCKGDSKNETCNNLDDDCDGQIDNNIQTRPCYTGSSSTKNKGACKDGKSTCRAGFWSHCEDEVKPIAEVCDGKDNDCDGQVDESYPEQGSSCQETGWSKGKQQCLGGKIHCLGSSAFFSLKAAHGVGISRDNKHVLAINDPGTITKWNVGTKEKTTTPCFFKSQNLLRCGGMHESSRISPNLDSIITKVGIFSLATQKQVSTISVTKEHFSDRDQLSFSKSGNTVYAPSPSSFRMVSATTGAVNYEIKAPSGSSIRAFALSQDKAHLVIQDKKELIFYETNGAKRFKTKSLKSDKTAQLSFTADRNTIMAVQEKEVTIWRVQGAKLYSYSLPEVYSQVKLSLDGKMIVALHDGAVKVFDAINGKMLYSLKEQPSKSSTYWPTLFWRHPKFHHIIITAGGLLLGKNAGSGYISSKIVVWDIGKGTKKRELFKYRRLYDFKFSTDGSVALFGTYDGVYLYKIGY